MGVELVSMIDWLDKTIGGLAKLLDKHLWNILYIAGATYLIWSWFQ